MVKRTEKSLLVPFTAAAAALMMFAASLLLPPSRADAIAPPASQYGGATFAIPSAMAPGIPTNLTVGASASVGTTLSAGGQCVRITCTADCFFRVTQGASTAVATDNYLPAQTPERFCLFATQDTVTFFNSGGSSLTANVAKSSGPQ